MLAGKVLAENGTMYNESVVPLSLLKMDSTWVIANVVV